ncbi:MAG: nucleoside triphosphate pyrophosphohydrolase, partial [Lentisphaeria bacterium]|nr:nucleoside triphosphate pyrophosphohydrolase [Lentisphaeria bacterium]
MDYKNLPPSVDSLVAILQKLRAPDGCPWDREQTMDTLARCMTEELAEYLDALAARDIPAM